MEIKERSFKLISDVEIYGHYLVEEVIHFNDGTIAVSREWTANEHILLELLPEEFTDGESV